MSSATAFFSYRLHLHQEQVEYLQHVGQDIDWAEWKPFGPHWLREITGPHMWNWGDRLIAVQVEHSDEIATLPGRDTVKVLRISTVRCDSMPSLAEYRELVAVDLSLANYDYTDFIGPGDPEFLPCVTVIAQCESLEGLGLYDGLVTDAGLPKLSTMPHLRHLDLSCNDITDAGLVHLAQMKSLRKLGLWGTKVTKVGVERLRAQLPACVVLWEYTE